LRDQVALDLTHLEGASNPIQFLLGLTEPEALHGARTRVVIKIDLEAFRTFEMEGLQDAMLRVECLGYFSMAKRS